MSELTLGTKVGRALTKLDAMDAEEARALADSPTKIKERYAKRRTEFLDDLEAEVRKRVDAARGAG